MRSMILYMIAALCCSAAQSAEPEPADRLIVVLKADSLSQGEQVLLSEIASIDASSTLKIAADKIIVGRAALPGQVRAFNAIDVAAAIRRSGCIAGIETKGAAETKVVAARQIVTGQSLADNACASVRAELSKDSDLEADLDITSVPADAILRPGAVEIRTDIPESGLRPGAQSIKVRVSQASRVVAEIVVGLRLRITGTISVADDRVNAGDLLIASSIKPLRKELNSVEFSQRCDASSFTGLRAKRAIPAGQMLVKALFAQPHLIKRGDTVTVVVRRGNLELAANAEAKTDAAMDETVRLVMDNGSEVVARASGLREACIDDPGRRPAR